MCAGGTRCSRLKPAARPVGSDPGTAIAARSDDAGAADESRSVTVGDTLCCSPLIGYMDASENDAEYIARLAVETGTSAARCGLEGWNGC